MFKRSIEHDLQVAKSQFAALTVTGPRQSGKTTLLKTLYPEMVYCLLESPDTLARVRSDPRGYIELHMDKGIIFDEAQNLPEIFSYLQEYIDHNQTPGQFILSGSQNFLLLEQVSQTLAGRTAVLELLPLTYQEFLTDMMPIKSVWEYLFSGSYPGPYSKQLSRKIRYQSYITTYIERDVRQMMNIKDLAIFHQFLKLCAGRHAQILNVDALAVDAGISPKSAEAWLSLLEKSYILFRLKPYHRNFNKRLIKTPKLYFYDSGLVCHLLEIDSFEHLAMHHARGAIFEGFVICEIIKQYYNQLKTPNVFFWRDHRGDEIDVIIEKGDDVIAVEIKSSQTLTEDLFKGVKRWQKISTGTTKTCLIYAGSELEVFINNIDVFNWQNIPKLLETV